LEDRRTQSHCHCLSSRPWCR